MFTLESQQLVPWIRGNFKPPTEACANRFQLKVLGPQYVEEDFKAVMVSRGRLRDFFGTGDVWPSEHMTLEDNRHDLEWHKSEFERQSSFTYTVREFDRSEVAGCVYVYPPTRLGYDVELFAWLRSDRYSTEQESRFVLGLKDWLRSEWHFTNIGMPGYEVSWLDWNKLPPNHRKMPTPYSS